MAAIDIGAVEGYADIVNLNWTFILSKNPANLSGKITILDFGVQQAVTGLKVAIFQNVGGTNFTARDSQSLGNFAAGEHLNVACDLDVVAGDYIGLYNVTGYMGATVTGADGLWRLAGDQTACVNATFAWLGTYNHYLYGEGATTGWANIAKVSGVTSASIAKMNGVAVASIAKVNGVAV